MLNASASTLFSLVIIQFDLQGLSLLLDLIPRSCNQGHRFHCYMRFGPSLSGLCSRLGLPVSIMRVRLSILKVCLLIPCLDVFEMLSSGRFISIALHEVRLKSEMC